jgi:hypothetical protein
MRENNFILFPQYNILFPQERYKAKRSNTGKRGVTALEKYSVATFYYLGGNYRDSKMLPNCTSQEQPTISYHRDSKMLPHCTSQEQPPFSYYQDSKMFYYSFSCYRRLVVKTTK